MDSTTEGTWEKFDLIDGGIEEDAPEEGRATERWVEDDTREFDGQDDTRERVN